MKPPADRTERILPPRPHSTPALWIRLFIGSILAALCVLASCQAARHIAFLQPYGMTGFSLLVMVGCLMGMTALTLCIGVGNWQRIQHLAIRYRSLHGWIGITTGSLLAMGFLAGTVTLFATPLQQWSQPHLPAQRTIPLTDLPAILSRLHLPEHESSQKGPSALHYRLTLTAPSSASLSIPTGPELPLGLPASQILVSQPAPGTVRLYQLIPSPVPSVIGGLHRRMGLPLPESWAMPLVGIICFLYGLALLSGVILLLPGIWRTLMTVRLEGHARRLWLDLHSLLGLCSLPFQLIIALTVALFAFAPFLPACTDMQPTPAQVVQPSATLPPTTILAQLRAIAPEFQPLTLDYALGLHGTDSLADRLALHAPLYNASGLHGLPPAEQPYLLVEGTDPHNPLIGRDRGSVLLDPHTGLILDSQNLPSRQSLARRLLTWGLALHFGSFGGEFVRWLYVILGLCGVGFFHTANQLWLNTHRRKVPGQAALADTAATLWLGRLSEGTLSGCLLGLCGLIVLSPLMSHLHPVTALNGIRPHLMERAYQHVSMSYYALMVLSLVGYCLLPRQLCRGVILGLSALFLSTAVMIVTVHHTATQTPTSPELTIAFGIASLCLWGGAFHMLRPRK